MTFDATRYSFDDMFGGGKISVGPPGALELRGLAVLAHEVGHWFGLSHIDYESDRIPDFMQDRYRGNACATLLSIGMMGNLDEEQHARRLDVGAGLRRALPGEDAL
jgi:hypothetical protein